MSAQMFLNVPEGGRRPSAAGRTRRAPADTSELSSVNTHTRIVTCDSVPAVSRCSARCNSLNNHNLLPPELTRRRSRISAWRRRRFKGGSG